MRNAGQPQPARNWGGARKGAGRKPIGPEPLVKVTVSVTKGQLAFLRGYGVVGNVGEGVRALITDYLTKATKEGNAA